MQYRRLGSSGLKVSALSFGSWVTFGKQLDEDRALACMRVARAAGVNFFDNAEVYADGEAERIMGKAIRRSGWKRSDLVVSTKLYWGGPGPNDKGLSAKHIREGLEGSLERLGLAYVDLLFCHRPDPETPIEETVAAMHGAIARGQALYWGTSEWSAQQIMEAWAVARREHHTPPRMEQPQYNLFHRERVEKEYARLYREIGLGTTVWSPLAGGVLAGRYQDGIPPDSRATLPGYEWFRGRVEGEEGLRRKDQVHALAGVAKDVGASLAQLAIAWCLVNPHVSSVILGASREEQLEENLGALELAPRLDASTLARIEQIVANKPTSGDPDYK